MSILQKLANMSTKNMGILFLAFILVSMLVPTIALVAFSIASLSALFIAAYLKKSLNLKNISSNY